MIEMTVFVCRPVHRLWNIAPLCIGVGHVPDMGAQDGLVLVDPVSRMVVGYGRRGGRLGAGA